MAATLPSGNGPYQPPCEPPSSALPPLPIPKSRLRKYSPTSVDMVGLSIQAASFLPPEAATKSTLPSRHASSASGPSSATKLPVREASPASNDSASRTPTQNANQFGWIPVRQISAASTSSGGSLPTQKANRSGWIPLRQTSSASNDSANSIPIRKASSASSGSASSIPTQKANQFGWIPLRQTSSASNDSAGSIPTQKASPASRIPTPQAKSASNIPTLASISGTPSQTKNKSVRRTISISTFPQPPKGAARISSLPPRSLARGAKQYTPAVESRRGSSDINGAGTLVLTRPSILSKQTSRALLKPNTSSLQNGIHNSAWIPIDNNGPINLPSPHQSQSTSMAESCSATSTTFEDVDEHGFRAREDKNPTSSNRSSQSDSKEAQGNVIVSVRVRPETVSSDDGEKESDWLVDGQRSLVAYRGRERGDYYYDNVFTTHDSNAKVYDSSAKRLVRRVMEGYNGTVFAYGMTGTGKTFSMQGTNTSLGIIPLAIADIFDYIRETPHKEFKLRVSYLEIYNERIHDLLAAPALNGLGAPGLQQQAEIKLREDSKRGVYATPLEEEVVLSPTQLLRVIAKGDQARRTSSTHYNTRSSRSHAIVQITVESRERVSGNGPMHDNKSSALPPSGVRLSTLSLIDLAGSERAAENKERRTEGAHINKSLLTLGTVIGRLSGEKRKRGPTDDRHLPYRDSKLTRLLQPALSGDSLISILCTIRTGSKSSAETLNTLKFASRAKNNIVSHAKRAEALGGGSGDAASQALLERYRAEILELRAQLEERGAQGSPYGNEGERHQEQLVELKVATTALKSRIHHLDRLIESSPSTATNTSGQSPSVAHTLRIIGVKDAVIADLRSRLDEQDRLIAALRSTDR